MWLMSGVESALKENAEGTTIHIFVCSIATTNILMYFIHLNKDYLIKIFCNDLWL